MFPVPLSQISACDCIINGQRSGMSTERLVGRAENWRWRRPNRYAEWPKPTKSLVSGNIRWGKKMSGISFKWKANKFPFMATSHVVLIPLPYNFPLPAWPLLSVPLTHSFAHQGKEEISEQGRGMSSNISRVKFFISIPLPLPNHYRTTTLSCLFSGVGRIIVLIIVLGVVVILLSVVVVVASWVAAAYLLWGITSLP